MSSSTKLLPLQGTPRFCVAIKLPPDVISAVESGDKKLGLSLGKRQNVLQIGDEEFPLIVTGEDKHVAYQSVSGGHFQEIGSVMSKARLKPRAKDAPPIAKRRAKDSTNATRTVVHAGADTKRKSDSPKDAKPKKRQRPKPAAAALPKASEKGELTMQVKRQRVIHVLATQSTTTKGLKAHTLLRTIPEEELGRMARSVADMRYGKFELRKTYYQQLDPSYSLLTFEELRQLETNIVQKGGIQPSECVPLQPDAAPAPKPKPAKATPESSTGGVSAMDIANRQAAAALLKKSNGKMLSEDQSREAEITELKLRMQKNSQAISCGSEAERMKQEYREKYPEYMQLNATIEQHKSEFEKLKSQYANARSENQKSSVGKKIHTKYDKMHNKLKNTLHKYNILHIELAHLKAKLKQWEHTLNSR